MSPLLRQLAILIATILLFWTQDTRASQEIVGSQHGVISGRVTLAGRAGANVVVLLFPQGPGFGQKPIKRAKTDADGKYVFEHVPPSAYRVVCVAPSFALSNALSSNSRGIAITVGPGESIDNADVVFDRGAVITGRVTDEENRPVVGEFVDVQPMDYSLGIGPPPNVRMYLTDDRGIYRIYGLASGSYIVSIGSEPEAKGGDVSSGNEAWRPRVFYPDAAIQSEAQPVVVASGGEATNINLVARAHVSGLNASGRVIRAGTEAPISDARVGFGVVSGDGNTKRLGAYTWAGSTDTRGAFQLRGLRPGRYAVFVSTRADGVGVYADPVEFTVSNRDVADLTIQCLPGAAITGSVGFEGPADAEALTKMRALTVSAYAEPPGSFAANAQQNTSKIADDGAFVINGLRPGTYRLRILSAFPDAPFGAARIEHTNAGANGTLTVGEHEDANGVRIVLIRGTAQVRVHVMAEGAATGEVRAANVRLIPIGLENGFGRTVTTDARGMCTMSGIPAGEYSVEATVFSMTGTKVVNKRVTVSDGVMVDVDLNVGRNGLEGAQ